MTTNEEMKQDSDSLQDDLDEQVIKDVIRKGMKVRLKHMTPEERIEYIDSCTEGYCKICGAGFTYPPCYCMTSPVYDLRT